MQKYPYQGLLGTKAEQADIPIAVYLKLPAYSVEDIGKLQSTLYVLKETRMSPDVMNASPEMIGAEPKSDVKKITLTAEDIEARKLNLEKSLATGEASASALLGHTSPQSNIGPVPYDAFTNDIHKAVQANANGYTGAGVRVAEVDLGIDFGHPELQGTWALFNVSTVPASILAKKPYLAEYHGWTLALNPDGVLSYLNTGGFASASHGFTQTNETLTRVTVGTDEFLQWNRDSPLVTPDDILGIPQDGVYQGTAYPDVFFSPAEPVTPVPFTVPAGTVQMNIRVAFDCVDIDAALVYDSNGNGIPEISELVSWEETSTGNNPEVFPSVLNPKTANGWFVMLEAFDATACTANILKDLVSIVTQVVNYKVTGIASASGDLHVGKFWDSRLVSRYFMRPGVLVVDSTSPGFYDTAYVDLNNDFDFTDEMPMTRGAPAAWHDLDGDGFADLSAGAVVYISNAGTRTGVTATVGTATSVSGTTAVGGETWAQLPDGNITVNHDPTMFLNGVPWSVVAVTGEDITPVPTAGARNLQLSAGSVKAGSVTLAGTDIQVAGESALTIADPATDTSFSTRNAGLLDINVYRDRTSPSWYGPKLVKLVDGLDYTANLATGLVTFQPRIISNPNPFIANLAGDLFRVWYNYTGTISTQDYTVNLASGAITLAYGLKSTSTVLADFSYAAWKLNHVTGNLTLTVALAPGDVVTADYQYGVTPIPYSDVITARLGVNNYYWSSGDLVIFTGALYGSHGTNVATQIAGQGVMPYLLDANGNLQPASGRFRGVAPDAKLINIPTSLATSSIIQGWYFAVEGYDGAPATGDEAQVITNSWGIPGPILGSGFGGTERLADWLTLNYSKGTATLVKSAGNNGWGYGMMSDEGIDGIVTVGASDAWYYRTAPEHNFDGGPNPAYGDLAYFSAWGPTGAGKAGVDVAFTGEFVYAAQPLNSFGDAAAAWVLTSGTSFSAPIAAGTTALIYDAYKQAHAAFPDTKTVKELLLSGADRMNQDVFSAGAGIGDALRSTNLAAQLGGIRASPYAWYPGNYRGTDYATSVHLLSPGESDTGAITLTNEGPADATVSVAATEFQSIGTTSYSFTPSVPRPFMPAGQNWTVVQRGVIKDWSGRTMGSYDPSLWDNADLIRVTGSYAHDTFASAARTIFFEPFDWTDAAPNGRFWGQSTNVTAVSWCPSGEWVASGGTDDRVTVWDAATGLPVRQLTLTAPYVNDIDWTSSCSYLAVATGNPDTLGLGRVNVFRTSDWARIRNNGDRGFGYPITAVAFSPDGTKYAFTSYVNSLFRLIFGLPPTDTSLPDVIVRSVATGGLLSLASGHQDVVNDVSWSADSSMIITAGGDTNWLFENAVLVFSVATNPATYVRGYSGHADSGVLGIPADGVKAVAFYPNGQRAVSAGLDDVVNVWSLTSVPTPWLDSFTSIAGGDVFIPLTFANVEPLSYSVLLNGAPVNEVNWFAGTGDYMMVADQGFILWFGFDSGSLAPGDILDISYAYDPPVDIKSQSAPDSIAIDPAGSEALIGSFGAHNAVGYTVAATGLTFAYAITPVWDVNGVVSVGALASGTFYMGSWGGELSERVAADGSLTNRGTDWNGLPFNPFGLTGFFLERNRMGVYIGTENVFEMRIHNPAARTHDGLAIWWRHLSGPPVNTPVTVQIQFFQRKAWSWISGLPSTPQTITASGTLGLAPRVDVPADAPIGLYEGQIEVDDSGMITTIPVVVNVAFKGGSIFQIGGAYGPDRLYNNGELRAFGEDGDIRLFFFDAPSSFVLSATQRWTVDFSLEGRDSYAVPRHAIQTPDSSYFGHLFSALNRSRYGPFVLTETDIGAPGVFKKSVDWRGQGNGVFRALSAGPGLNLLAIESSALNGTNASERFSGTTGLMSVTPNPILVSTNKLQSAVNVSVSTTTAWQPNPDPFDSSYGKGISVATSQANSTVIKDLPVASYCPAGLPRCEGSMTFQQYLFGAPNRFKTELPPLTLAASWVMFFHNGASDVDFGLWYDADCDGVYAITDDAAGSVGATAGNPEKIALTLPRAGCYWLHAAGFDVPPGGALYDLTFSLTKFGASAFVPQGVPETTIAPNTAAQFELAWSFDPKRPEGVASEVLFISPGNAPFSLAELVTLTVSYDLTPPGFSAHVPAPGSVTTDSTPSIFVQVDDPQPGAFEPKGEIDERSIRVWLDGGDITAQAFVSVPFQAPGSTLGGYGYSIGIVLFTPPEALPDGRHTMLVQAGDFAGNLATTTWDFFIDTTAPLLEITSPPAGFATSAASVTLEGRTESGTALTVGGQAVAVAADGTFSTDVSLVAGSNSFEVRALDAIGNAASTTVIILRDATAPSISALRSSAGVLTNAGLTVISGVVSEAASLSVAGIPATVRTDGSFEVPVSLVEGVNAIQLTAVDAAGNQGTATLSVTRDSTPPILTLNSLPSETSSATVTVTGQVESGISFVTVNGQPVAVSGGTFSQDVALSFGSNVIFVEATDGAGNRASASAAVSYVPTGVTTTAVGLILLPVLAVIALLVGLAVGQAIQGRRAPPGKEEMPPTEEAAPPAEEELPPKEGEL